MTVGISPVGGNITISPISERLQPREAQGQSFQKALGDAADSLSKLQLEADVSTAKLATGEPIELHEALLATERASIAFQLAVQVRNKIVEAYQDVMRMQV